MVKVKRRPVLCAAAAILAVAGLACCLLLRRSEEHRIRRRLRQFALAVRRRDGEGGLKAMVNARRIGTFFDDPTTIDVDGLGWLNGTCDPDTIVSNAFRARQLFLHLDLVFDGLELSVRNDHARGTFTALLEGRLKSGDSVREVRELAAEFRKRDREWLLRSVRIRDVIRR